MGGHRARTRAVALLLALTMLFTMMVATPAAAGGEATEVPRLPFNMEVMGHVPGAPGDAVAVGDALYVAGGHAIDVYDMSGADPELVRTVFVYEEVLSLWADTDRLFAVGESWFAILDISTPLEPELLGDTDMPSSYYDIVGFYAVGDVAYASYQKYGTSHGTKMFNIANPANPKYAGYCELSFWDRHADVWGSYAYVVTDLGFSVIDNGDPLHPSVIHTYDDVFIAGDLALGDGLLFLNYGDPEDSEAAAGIEVFDLSTPYAPARVGEAGGSLGWAVAAGTDRAWVIDDDSGVTVYDVSTPSVPVTSTTVEVPGAVSLTASDTAGYVPFIDEEGPAAGVAVLDNATPSTLAWDDTLPGILGAAAADVDEGVAYIGHAGGLTTVDVSEPGTPSVLGSFETSAAVLDVEVDGTTAYLACGTEGVWIVDVTTPTSPSLIGRFQRDRDFVSLAYADGVLYVAEDTGLRSLDVSTTPSDPTSLDRWLAGMPAHDVELKGDRAYVAVAECPPCTTGELRAASADLMAETSEWDTALVSLDISAPGDLAVVSDHGIPSTNPRLAIGGNRAYVQVGDPEWGGSYIKAFDISDPDYLHYKSWFKVEKWTTDVAARGNGLLFTASERNTQVREVANLSEPRLVGDMPVGTDALTVAGDLLVGLDEVGGAYFMAYDPVSERDFGGSRYDTAVDLSREFASAETVVITTGLDFPDALTAAPLAYALDAPILLVRPDYVPGSVTREIERLGASKAYVIGGEGVLTDKVIDELKEVGITAGSITRLAGANRFDTAKLIALELDKVTGGDGIEKAFIATGENFPDALAASSVAARLGAPILLTERDELPVASKRALTHLGTTDTFVLGGPAVISDAVLDELPNPTRLWGDDRYQTAKAVADWALDESGAGLLPTDVFVVTGLNFPDAMPCGVIAARNDSAMILVGDSGVPSPTRSFLRVRRGGIEQLRIVGGTSAISTDVERVLVGLLQ